MNIFVLAISAAAAALLHNDVHVVKMTTETTQLLYMVLRRWGVPLPLTRHLPIIDAPMGQRKHICTLWAAACLPHFKWLLALGLALAERYAEIFGREHACFKHLRLIKLHLFFAGYPSRVPHYAVTATEFLRELDADPSLPSDIVSRVSKRIAKQKPPHGCFFGILAIGVAKLPSVFTDEDILVEAEDTILDFIDEDVVDEYDAVDTYRRYYAMKLEFAKRTNDLRFDRKPDNVPSVYAPLRQDVRSVAASRGYSDPVVVPKAAKRKGEASKPASRSKKRAQTQTAAPVVCV